MRAATPRGAAASRSSVLGPARRPRPHRAAAARGVADAPQKESASDSGSSERHGTGLADDLDISSPWPPRAPQRHSQSVWENVPDRGYCAQELVGALERAVRCGEGDEAATTAAVKEALQVSIARGDRFLPHAFRRESGGPSYSRWELFTHPEGLFSAIVMVWGPGQGTALHDHGGLWCVECVYEGAIRVRSYDRLLELPGDLALFREADAVRCEVGAAGALVPPRDYHVLENASDTEKAVTVHIYGGEMAHCAAYDAVEKLAGGVGLYKKDVKSLGFNAGDASPVPQWHHTI